jgi:cob(I)alamin adenosyltransferase
MTDRARILIFTGEGKGKTTAALGMALRARGHGMTVAVIQFIKGNSDIGEASAARQAGIDLHQAGLGFLPPRDAPRWARHSEAARKGLRLAGELAQKGPCDLLVLDEVCLAAASGLLEEADVLALMRSARPGMVLALTGRGATDAMIALADTVTEMRCVKHGMQIGRAAQKGVEL